MTPSTQYYVDAYQWVRLGYNLLYEWAFHPRCPQCNGKSERFLWAGIPVFMCTEKHDEEQAVLMFGCWARLLMFVWHHLLPYDGAMFPVADRPPILRYFIALYYWFTYPVTPDDDDVAYS